MRSRSVASGFSERALPNKFTHGMVSIVLNFLRLFYQWCCNFKIRCMLLQSSSIGQCNINLTIGTTAGVAIFLSISLVLMTSDNTIFVLKSAKNFSYTLAHNRKKRNAVIFVTFFVMCLSTALSVVIIKDIGGMRLFQFKSLGSDT